MEATIDKLIDAMIDLVDDDSAPWTGKRDAVLARVKGDARAETSLEEFVAWFEGEEK